MGVDPVSMFVAALVVAALVKRVPDIVADLAEAASQGESAEDKSRRERLKNAGIDPPTGGAARRYFGSLWRDAWLDLDEKRQARRTGKAAGRPTPAAGDGRSWLDRLADKVDATASATTNRWRADPADRTGDANRHRPEGHPRPEDAELANWPPGSPAPVPTTDVGDPDAAPSDADTLLRPAPPGDGTAWWQTIPISTPHRHPEPAGRGSTATLERHSPDPPPPTTNQRVIEGEIVTAVVPARGGAVTGGSSGAAEAKAIQRAVEDANNAYVAAMEAIKRRIVSLGEQTLEQVQMAQRSHVVQLTAQAAEAAGAAQAAAKRCGLEVVPILGQVARAFQRLLT